MRKLTIVFGPSVFKCGRLFRLVSRGQLALNSANSICFPQTIQNKSDINKLYLSTPCFPLGQRDQSSSFSLGARRSTDGIPAKGVCKWETYANEQNHPIGSYDTLCEWRKLQNHPITGHVCHKNGTYANIWVWKSDCLFGTFGESCISGPINLAFMKSNRLEYLVVDVVIIVWNRTLV